MEEDDATWRIKCTSRLPSLPPISPPPLTSSAPAPPSLASTSLLNQMGTNSGQFFRPFAAQKTSFENRDGVQESLVFQTLNLDFAKSRKADLVSNSVPALLSGNPHSLLGEISQGANLRPALAKVQAPSGVVISGSRFVESRPGLLTASNQIATSKQAFVGGNEGMATLSNSFQSVSQNHSLSSRASNGLAREAGSAVPVIDSGRSRGRPHVMCMNTVGELFLTEVGILGVVCICHNLHMSVGNFCKHSGCSANPGEAVQLVNGMSIARWCKQYFGSNAPDDCKGWDWSDAPSAKIGLIGSEGNTFPIFPQNPGTAGSPPTFVRLGKPGDSLNKSLFPNSPYISFGQAPIRQLANKDANNMNQRYNRLEGPNHSSKNFTIASQSHMPALPKNQTVNESSDNHNLKGKFGTSSFIYPYSDAKQPFPRESNFNRDGFTNDAYMLAREGSSSKIDLRLGQPSQVHGPISSFSTTINPLQFAARNSQKSQVKRPPKEKTDQLKEPKKPRLNLECSAFESPKENKGLSQHAVGGNSTSSNPGSEGFSGTPMKSSLISLFLSQLNNEGSNSSQLTNTINKSKHSVLDLASAKCNISEHASDLNVGHERNNILYGSDHSNNMDKEKQSKFYDDRRFSLHFGESPRTLQGGSDSRISSQYGKAPSVVNWGNFNHAINSSMVPFSCANSTLGLPKSGAPLNSSSNSMYISEPTGPCHSKNIDHSQHFIDENMRFLALRHMVELSRQEKSVTSLQVSPGHQRLCCHLAGMEDLKQESSYGIHASQFNSRSEQTCNNCYSGSGVGNLGAKLGKRDQNEHCNCAALAQRSEEQDVPTCHACGAEEPPGLRLGGIPNYSSGSSKQIFDQKEQATPFFKRCYCSLFSNHLTQCCFSRDCSPSHPNKQSICGNTRTNHITHICDNELILHDRMGLCSCECPKKQFFIKNDCQTGLWRDVPTKKTDNTDAALIGKPYHLQKSSSRTQHESESMNEQQMSNVCSDSSAPAVTELSVEVNKVNYSAMNGENKTVYEIVSDEGSVVEKCGSTDGEPGVTECAGTIAVKGMVELPSHSADNLNDELKLDSSSNRKMLIKQLNAQYAVPDNVKEMKMNNDVLVPKPGFNPINSGSSHCINHLSEVSPPNGGRALSQSEVVMQKANVKRKRSSLYSVGPTSLKRDSHYKIPNDILESNNFPAVDDDQSLIAQEIPSENEVVSVNKEKQSPSHSTHEGSLLDSDKPPKYMSLSCTINSDNFGKRTVDKKTRPVVCGKSGIISNGGVNGQRKPAKMLSLSLILKKTERCDLNENGAKPKGILDASDECHNELSSKLQPKNEDSSAYKRKRRNPTRVLVSGTIKECFSGSDTQVDEYPIIENETDGLSEQVEELALHHKYRDSQSKPRYREVRSCSLSKLLGIDKNPKLSHVSNLGASGSSHINRTGDETITCPSIATGDPLIDTSFGRKPLDDEDGVGGPGQKNTERSDQVQKCVPFLPSSDAACCVCGNSSKQDIDCIIECKSCSIQVHQACYGVSKVPKGHWYCRPCKTKAQNTVCVLCGYEGGAMTRAVKSQNIVQSLLKAWKFDTDSCFIKLPPPEFGKCEASKIDKSCLLTALRLVSCDAFPEGSVNLTPQGQASMPKELQMNSIIAGVLDPSAAQWVHMICGLWTPGTRCPNVDTMSAFDVSGASTARRNTICSICNRPGGSCTRCRVLNCSVHFHPWCAHQKGLLQSEIEGDNNDKIGFYGRCMHHAAQNSSTFDNHPIDAEGESPRKDWSSARTESFKGRKSDKGFKPLRRAPYSDSRGCIVSQEQINAWFHINGHKSCARAVVKLPSSDVEYDCRKEYFRYKQTKAWKHLVVYKSGIHALGLYTSQFILRGAMVVEYVGEIVGQRVADKREIEYQTGRRLQYKSACYFFRIDKEHIIDATRKGGIARFVNHSCMPNCVAKVISVGNEKKVVFFAERDINPGEEITYDYHFNSEDEGQKIPCYCNSKHCRQYLN